jgi:hypothetical protein
VSAGIAAIKSAPELSEARKLQGWPEQSVGNLFSLRFLPCLDVPQPILFLLNILFILKN